MSVLVLPHLNRTNYKMSEEKTVDPIKKGRIAVLASIRVPAFAETLLTKESNKELTTPNAEGK